MVRSCCGRGVLLPYVWPELPEYRGSRDISVGSRACTFGVEAAVTAFGLSLAQ